MADASLATVARRVDLQEFGFVVLRSWFDAADLSGEFDTVTRLAFGDAAHRNSGEAGNSFRYVPVMCDDTPVSLALTRQAAVTASELLDGPVLPGRTKATTYFGTTAWHRDSTSSVRSIGMVAYLEPLEASTRGFCVMPGSHEPQIAAEVEGSRPVPGVALLTDPGDLIVFDEHLLHASESSGRRRQWRVDFVLDDGDDQALARYYAGTFSPEWDGGYDVDRFPSFGASWRARHPEWTGRLTELGVIDAAHAEEDAARARRTTGLSG